MLVHCYTVTLLHCPDFASAKSRILDLVPISVTLKSWMLDFATAKSAQNRDYIVTLSTVPALSFRPSRGEISVSITQFKLSFRTKREISVQSVNRQRSLAVARDDRMGETEQRFLVPMYIGGARSE